MDGFVWHLMPERITCLNCAAENAVQRSIFTGPASCARCSEPLRMGLLNFAVHRTAPMRYSLALALALSIAVLLIAPTEPLDQAAEASTVAMNSPEALPSEEGFDQERFDAVFGPSAAAADSGQPVQAPIVDGVHRVFASSPRVAPLTIITPAGVNYYVKLVDAVTKEVWLTAYISGGETLRTKVPLGSARIKYATGVTWEGEDTLFGRYTQYSEAEDVFDFKEEEDGVVGYTVELIQQLNGNLDTRGISANDF